MSKYHKILGLQAGASEIEIKKAYRKLALKFHPDTSNKDASKFHQIKEAYEFLLQNQNYKEKVNSPIKREDDKIFVRKYNKWVTEEEYQDIINSAEKYRKKKQYTESNRAKFEFEQFKKSKTYHAFKYISILGIIFATLLLIDNFKNAKSYDAIISKVSIDIGYYHPVTVIQYKIDNTVSTFSYYGRKKNFLEKGVPIKVYKSSIFKFDKQIITNDYIFFNKNKSNDFHLPIAFFFLIFIFIGITQKSAKPIYYFAVNTVVYGIPVLVAIFLLFVSI